LVIEYKKIGLTKYRVRLHSANGLTPLVLGESYHSGWSVFPGRLNWSKIDSKLLQKYKILEGNELEQVAPDKIAEYINKGWVTGLGYGSSQSRHLYQLTKDVKSESVENYQIDFVSSNNFGTIQNDNLPNGVNYETWFKEDLDLEVSRFVANGYANGWILEVDNLCSELPEICIKNEDGSYDLELLLEFRPQRLLYLGIGVSGVLLLLCAGILLFIYFKSRK